MEFLTPILELLHRADTAVLLAVNGLHTPWLDTVMYTVSMRTVWIPLYLLLLYCVWRRYGMKGAFICLAVVLVGVALADQFCGSVLRGFCGRMRPSNPDNEISSLIHIVNNHRGGRYGFPSCHAANTAVVAVTLSLWLKRRSISVALFAWAALVSVSRIFLGVHYPGDVLAGFVIGSSIALLVNMTLHRIYLGIHYFWPRLRLPVIPS